MKKKLLAALAGVLLMAGVAIVFPLSSAHAVEVFRMEMETRIYNTAKVGGYLLLGTSVDTCAANSSAAEYLCDPMGRVLKTLNSSACVQLMPDGTWNTASRIMTWEGTVLHTISNPSYGGVNYSQHHDGKRIWNKKMMQYTYLQACNASFTTVDSIAAGKTTGTTGTDDGVVEVDETGTVLWLWRYRDHTFQTADSNANRYLDPNIWTPGSPEYLLRSRRGLNVNRFTDEQGTTGGGLTGEWIHQNAADYDEERDWVCMSAKNTSQAICVDHGKSFVSTTDFAANVAAAKSSYFNTWDSSSHTYTQTLDQYLAAFPPGQGDGDHIWKFGRSFSYGAGEDAGFNTDGTSQHFGNHSVTCAPTFKWAKYHGDENINATQKGYLTITWANPTAADVVVGGGNIIILDNGCYTASGYRSAVNEASPFINSAGVETCTPDMRAHGYVGCTPIWEYDAGWDPINNGVRKSKQLVRRFQALIATSMYTTAQSCSQKVSNGNLFYSGARGRMAQMAPDGEVVWDYSSSTAQIGTATTSNYRSYWIDPDNPGLLQVNGSGQTHLAELQALSLTNATRAGRAANSTAYRVVGSGGDVCTGSCCPMPAGTAPPCDGGTCPECDANCTDADYNSCVCAGCETCTGAKACPAPNCTQWCADNSAACNVCCPALDYGKCAACPGCESCTACPNGHTPTTAECAANCTATQGFDCDTCCPATTNCTECCAASAPNCTTCCPENKTCADCVQEPDCDTCCPTCGSITCAGANACPTCQTQCNGCPGSAANCTNCCPTYPPTALPTVSCGPEANYTAPYCCPDYADRTKPGYPDVCFGITNGVQNVECYCNSQCDRTSDCYNPECYDPNNTDFCYCRQNCAACPTTCAEQNQGGGSGGGGGGGGGY